MVLYISMSSKNTITPWSSMSINKLFIVCMNVAGMHLSAPWALQSIYKARTMSEMLSSVCFPLLYGITSIHYEDPMT